ncbi:hypothetical protein CSOJ01_03537 [Colletotrichum sojae]|uniref:BZIP domain-containing protein n=1 Tax=Colletotrichum sojae TaxID=2175907 RepID=A0A8H6JLI6_9PEZI|nr:hypothetical protein CSOJ01_03537 [Colletotrichum sojae]
MADTVNGTYNRPRTRQRIHKTPPALDIPDIEEDASERRRVLNVLAQRRYRKLTAPSPFLCPRERKRQTRLARQKQGDDLEPQVSETNINGTHAHTPVSGAVDLVGQPADVLPSNGEGDANAAFSLDTAVAWADLSDGTAVSEFICETMCPPSLDLDLSGDTGVTTSTTMSASPSTVDPASLLNGSSPSTDSCGFADSYLLPMSDLKVLKGLLRVATRLGSYSVMWDPAANSPFNLGTGTAAELLPLTWRPTATQVLTPHHPIMDFLPWPGVRDRIISVFNLPDPARPPAARGTLGLVNFAYDLEDSAEGARIWGADPYDASTWEVGQVLFERWWFLFDRSVIEQSNGWRQARGATPLQLKPGNVFPVEELSGQA